MGRQILLVSGMNLGSYFSLVNAPRIRIGLRREVLMVEVVSQSGGTRSDG
jgi:hypothetical protein